MIRLFLGALAAGWIDAVIGGGGLVLVPLLLSSGMVPVQALATNKIAGSLGTASAAAVLLHRFGRPDNLWRYVVVAFICSGCGALLASLLSKEIMRPAVIVLLVLAGIFVATRPTFGVSEEELPVQRPVLALLLVAPIAFYDGIFGPGTGLFLILVFTALLTGNFLQSTVLAKVVNLTTNLGSLAVFIYGGHVNWQLGLLLAAGTIIGAQIGARTIIGGGAKLVRIALLIMVIVMAIKLTFFP